MPMAAAVATVSRAAAAAAAAHGRARSTLFLALEAAVAVVAISSVNHSKQLCTVVCVVLETELLNCTPQIHVAGTCTRH